MHLSGLYFWIENFVYFLLLSPVEKRRKSCITLLSFGTGIHANSDIRKMLWLDRS